MFITDITNITNISVLLEKKYKRKKYECKISGNFGNKSNKNTIILHLLQVFSNSGDNITFFIFSF